MKKSIKYMFATLLAALIFYGGTGVNFISYCCDDCRSGGIEVVMDNKCCDIHQHNHDYTHDLCAKDDGCTHISEESCCSMERIDFEWDQSSNPVFHFQPVQIDLFSCLMCASMLYSDIQESETLVNVQKAPPLITCPRTYLSLLTTLLI